MWCICVIGIAAAKLRGCCCGYGSFVTAHSTAVLQWCHCSCSRRQLEWNHSFSVL